MSPVEAILSFPEKFKGDERKALGKEQDKRNAEMAQLMNPGRQRCVTARKRTAGLGDEGEDRWWASGGQRWEGSSLAEPPTALKSKGILQLQESIWIKFQKISVFIALSVQDTVLNRTPLTRKFYFVTAATTLTGKAGACHLKCNHQTGFKAGERTGTSVL